MWILALICHTKAVINTASQHTEPAVSLIRIQTWPKQSSQAVCVLRVCPLPLKAWNPQYVPDQIRRCPFVSLSPWPDCVWIHITLPNENDYSTTHTSACTCSQVQQLWKMANVFLVRPQATINPVDVLLWVNMSERGSATKHWSHTDFMGHAMALLSALMENWWEEEGKWFWLLRLVSSGCYMWAFYATPSWVFRPDHRSSDNSGRLCRGQTQLSIARRPNFCLDVPTGATPGEPAVDASTGMVCFLCLFFVFLFF